MIPALSTDRLTLRPHQLADCGMFRAFWMSDRASHIGGPLQHQQEVRRQFSAETGHWTLRGFVLWTLVGKAWARLGAVRDRAANTPNNDPTWVFRNGVVQ